MISSSTSRRALPLGLCLGLTAALATAQAPAPTPKVAKKNPAPATAPAPTPPPPVFEPKAIDVLRASCEKLKAAGSMAFTALGAYEVPSLAGPPLIYGRIYEVTLKRPDKLKVITVGDGPPTEFYDDGKAIMSFHPAENLVAVTEAPPTIDAALDKIYGVAGTYFPFTDVIVSDPWGDIESGLTTAFYLGQSILVGGTTTDVIAYECNGVFIQMWIGAEDKLPRMARAIFHDDPLQLRHSVQFSNWQLEPPVAEDAFTSAKAASAARIPFSNPAMKSDLPAAGKPARGPKKPAPKSGRAPTPEPR
jgi:hypothetical protein